MSLRWLPTVADIDREASPYETYGSPAVKALGLSNQQLDVGLRDSQ